MHVALGVVQLQGNAKLNTPCFKSDPTVTLLASFQLQHHSSVMSYMWHAAAGSSEPLKSTAPRRNSAQLAQRRVCNSVLLAAAAAQQPVKHTAAAGAPCMHDTAARSCCSDHP